MKILNLTFERHTVSIILNDNNFVTRWTTQLEKCLDNDLYAYEVTLNGFNQGNEFKNLRKTLQDLNKFKEGTVPASFTRKFEFTMQELSDLHFIYESIATNEIYLDAKKLVDQFNDNIHHAEEVALKNQSAAPRLRFRVVDPLTRVPNVEKLPFEYNDYKLYDPYIQPYTVYLNYNALGEDFLKTYKSSRSPDTAVVLEKYSPSFFFTLQADYIENQYREITKCKEWMKENNIDISNPKNNIGHIPLGRLHKVYSEDFLKVILQRKLKKVEIINA